MSSLSPKVEIINHFDKLINKVDIDIEESIEKYNDKQVLGELLNRTKEDKMKHWEKHKLNIFKLEFHATSDSRKDNEYQRDDLWSESAKVIDYLTGVRMKTVEELRKAQEESMENYKLHSSRLKRELTDVKNIDELKSILFADKFYFQVHFTQPENRLWTFNIFTIVTDFYMSPSDINSLE